MSADRINLLIEKGAKYEKTFQWTDTAGDPIDLTLYSARMHIRTTKNKSTYEAELTTENGKITFDAINGIINLALGATETNAFTFASGVYDLELYVTADEEDVTRLAEGIVTVSLNVTR